MAAGETDSVPVWFGTHWPVLNVQFALQASVPLLYPWVMQVWLFRFVPSHVSVPFIVPSPHDCVLVQAFQLLQSVAHVCVPGYPPVVVQAAGFMLPGGSQVSPVSMLLFPHCAHWLCCVVVPLQQ